MQLIEIEKNNIITLKLLKWPCCKTGGKGLDLCLNSKYIFPWSLFYLLLFQCESSNKLIVFQGFSSLHLTHVAFSPDGDEVLLNYSGEHVYLMDLNPCMQLFKLPCILCIVRLFDILLYFLGTRLIYVQSLNIVENVGWVVWEVQ